MSVQRSLRPPEYAAILSAALHFYFPDSSDQELAASLLNDYGHESWHRETERVRVAILKLADGSLDDLDRYVKAANEDYRDVLAWAEYPSQMQASPDAPDEAERREDDLRQYHAWLDSLTA